MYAYFEDDLIILDPGFFGKLIGFAARLVMIVCCCLIGLNSPLFLMLSTGFFIDGPIPDDDLRRVIPNPSPAIGSPIQVGQSILSLHGTLIPDALC